MSFIRQKRLIEKGDTVIIYLTINNYHAVEVKSQITNKHGQLVPYTDQTTHGALRVEELVGKEYGSKVQLSKGYCYVLQPNPELWTMNLPHRTQILYTPDISMILLQLEVKPGSRIVEAGTGSASLSHYFLRAIKSTGHLFTFDFHEARVEQAREEFQAHGLGDCVTVKQRDVCRDGFPEELNGSIDAVFLDLPCPSLAIASVSRILNSSGGRFCGFSPCIEQTQATCLELEKFGFIEIVTMEIIQSELIVKEKFIQQMDFEFLKTPKEDDGKTEDQKIMEDKKQIRESKRVLTTHPPPMQPGHSGFLTFATLHNVL